MRTSWIDEHGTVHNVIDGRTLCCKPVTPTRTSAGAGCCVCEHLRNYALGHSCEVACRA